VVTLYRAGHNPLTTARHKVAPRFGPGSPTTARDFTVIRSQQLGRTVLLSRAFDAFVESDFDLERVGEYPVRGFNDPISVPTTTLKH
jgi:hypothetical protein